LFDFDRIVLLARLPGPAKYWSSCLGVSRHATTSKSHSSSTGCTR
jgi:hypothetical protein